MKWLRSETNDHVLVELTIHVAIGVDESQDDIPNGFSNDVHNALKDLGIGVITSSIVPRHRQKFNATAREIFAKYSPANNKHILD